MDSMTLHREFDSDWSNKLSERNWEVVIAMADFDMSVSEVASALHMYRTAIVYHLDKIKEKSGLDPKNFYDLCKLLAIYDDIQEEEKGDNGDMYYVVKSDTGNYWCGLNKISDQLRKAQIYVSKKYALETKAQCNERFPSFGKFGIVCIELKEIGELK